MARNTDDIVSRVRQAMFAPNSRRQAEAGQDREISWNHIRPDHETVLAHAVLEVMANAWEYKEFLTEPHRHKPSFIDDIAEITGSLPTDFGDILFITDQQYWNHDELKRREERGEHNPLPRLTATPELTSRGNLSVRIGPYRDPRTRISDFAYWPEHFRYTPMFERPLNEILFIRRVERSFVERTYDKPLNAYQHMRSDIAALTVIAFRDVVSRLSKEVLPTVCPIVIDPVMTRLGYSTLVAYLRLVSPEDIEVEHEAARIMTNAMIQADHDNALVDHVRRLPYDPLRVAATISSAQRAGLPRKRLVEFLQALGISASYSNLDYEIRRIHEGLDLIQPEWRDVTAEPMNLPIGLFARKQTPPDRTVAPRQTKDDYLRQMFEIVNQTRILRGEEPLDDRWKPRNEAHILGIAKANKVKIPTLAEYKRGPVDKSGS